MADQKPTVHDPLDTSKNASVETGNSTQDSVNNAAVKSSLTKPTSTPEAKAMITTAGIRKIPKALLAPHKIISAMQLLELRKAAMSDSLQRLFAGQQHYAAGYREDGVIREFRWSHVLTPEQREKMDGSNFSSFEDSFSAEEMKEIRREMRRIVWKPEGTPNPYEDEVIDVAVIPTSEEEEWELVDTTMLVRTRRLFWSK